MLCLDNKLIVKENCDFMSQISKQNVRLKPVSKLLFIVCLKNVDLSTKAVDLSCAACDQDNGIRQQSSQDDNICVTPKI